VISHILALEQICNHITKSIDLDFDGVMIESHIDPDNAWSDAKQQITLNVWQKCWMP
jgi:chorismate mutase